MNVTDLNEVVTAGQPVRSLQRMLNQLAIYDPTFPRLTDDGVFGERTLEAVMVFQRENELPVTGVVNNDTWDAIVEAYTKMEFLYGTPPPLNVLPNGRFTAREGERGAPVLIVQAMFNVLSRLTSNFSVCKVNDINEGSTCDNLRVVQRLSGLPVTGALDRPTWVYLSQLYHALVNRG